jgi:hypothetical protein
MKYKTENKLIHYLTIGLDHHLQQSNNHHHHLLGGTAAAAAAIVAANGLAGTPAEPLTIRLLMQGKVGGFYL